MGKWVVIREVTEHTIRVPEDADSPLEAYLNDDYKSIDYQVLERSIDGVDTWDA